MSFQDALRVCITQKYVDFQGRASRSEYWWFALGQTILYILLAVIGAVIGVKQLPMVGSLALLLPGIAVAIRRMHDLGKSGWFLLIGLIPFVGGIILLVFTVKKGTEGANAYGHAVV